MRKFIVLLSLLFCFGIFQSCSFPKNSKNAYCQALVNSKLVNTTELENGNKKLLKSVINEYIEIRKVAPAALVPYWNILITKTSEAVQNSNSQVIDDKDKAGDDYVLAYKKILNNFNKNCG